MTGIDIDREFFVLALANSNGEYIGLRGQEYPPLGKVVLLFTTEEKLKEYAEGLDENQGFMDILERAPRAVGSEDMNLGYYVKTTVRALLPRLEDYAIDNLLVDYLLVGCLSPGGYNRVYSQPHRA